MRTLYLDCSAGVAGDMVLGALLDAGASEAAVRASLDALALPGWRLNVSEVTRASVRALRVEVTIEGAETSRSYADIQEILNRAPLPRGVLDRALRIFHELAQAEARVHGTSLEDVHLHEVGATDAMIDVVGVAAALEELAPDWIVASRVAVGTGSAPGAHGELPLPAPAVVELLRGAPIVGRAPFELATPTGAAILATVVDEFGDLPPMTLEAAGAGAGARDLEFPNVVRALVGSSAEAATRKDVLLVETNIDDMAPELFPYVIERLLAAGAQDAWTTPISMKKGRPALLLAALVTPAELDRVVDVLYRETTTLGVRMRPLQKDELERRWVEVHFGGSTVRVKLGLRGGEVITVSPEYDDAVAAARATGAALKDVYERARALAVDQVVKNG